MPGYEDVCYYLWRERRLPANVDPLKSNLEGQAGARPARARLRARLGTVVGYVLPLQRTMTSDDPQWVSGPWFLRDETLYLIPGDSPMGLRLPLDSLPWVAADDYPWITPHDPLRDCRRCRRGRESVPASASSPARVRARATGYGRGQRAQQLGEAAGSSRRRMSERTPEPQRKRRRGSCAPRCASSRATGGCTSSCRRCEKAEDYLDLVAAIEDAVARARHCR